MKTLILLRHAKSDWSSGIQRDHDRPLNRRGERAASTVGRFLAAIGEVPDGVISSSAVRARSTAELAIEAGGWDRSLEVTDELYDTTPESALAVARGTSEAHSSLLLAGHEPTWSELAGRLVGAPPHGATVRMVTACMVRIDFPVERWRDIGFGRGTLMWLIPPKLLQKGGVDG